MELIRRFFHPAEASYFLFGPRGTGKSTFLREAFADGLWIDLLQPEVHQRFAARPDRLRDLVDGNPEAKIVVLDEVQRIPALLDVVHHLIERRGRRAAPRFVLTGSSARKLRRTGVNLLAGRLLLERMHPFMAAELPSFDLAMALRRGMLPVVWDSDTPDATLASYVALYIREEVQAEGLVRRLDDFARFVEVISFSHGSVLNVSEVARETHTSGKTTEAYIGILEDLYLAFRLPVFRKRQKRQLVAHPKFYWFDAGVFRSVRPAGPFDRPEEIDGGALEGLVAQHLRGGSITRTRAPICPSGAPSRAARWTSSSMARKGCGLSRCRTARLSVTAIYADYGPFWRTTRRRRRVSCIAGARGLRSRASAASRARRT